MSEIKKIGLPSLKADLKPKKKSADSPVPGKAFEDLLQKLEKMPNEIDAAMQSSAAPNTTAVSRSVNTLGRYIKSIEGMVENFSDNRKSVPLPGKFGGLTQYEPTKGPHKT